MHPIRTFFSELYAAVFATSVQKKIENIILLLAGIGFIIHLSLPFNAQGVLLIFSQSQDLLNDPISAIYTFRQFTYEILITVLFTALFYLLRF